MDQKMLETFRALEESLWRSETRFDPEYMERILSPDFLEFGRSGSVFTREEILQTPNMEIRCKLPLHNFEVHPLSQEIVLTTYISEVLYEEWEYANRSSIWMKTKHGWQIRFHQGTPVMSS
jgi:hypothetical protein